MVHLGVYATLLEFQYKCGANASSVSTGQLYADSFLNQAEGLINATCRKQFATTAAAFALLPAAARQLLTEVATNVAAIYAIQYDMSGFMSRTEAEDMINVLRDGAMRGLSILRDKKTQDFLIEGA